MAKGAYLVLQDGQMFEGLRFGAESSPASKPADGPTGELVFTTGMTGYIETLTDPSYYGQMVLQTFPLNGNYGMIPADMESEKCHVTAYIVREWCEAPSNFRCESTIDAWLKQQGVVGLCGVDTRAITRVIRDEGVMNACILDNPPTKKDIERLSGYTIRNAVAAVSRRESAILPPVNNKRFAVALLDCGATNSIAHALAGLQCEVHLLPHDTTAEQVLALAPDGLLLSEGPGDPAENTGVIKEMKGLLGKLPILGIGLGHQLLALAAGAKTEKLKYGHRGANQPVKDLENNRIYITSQNHGYAVAAENIGKAGGKLTMVNVNDGTPEAIAYPDLRAFSVQFHPEVSAGTKDAPPLFERFLGMMGGKAYAAE